MQNTSEARVDHRAEAEIGRMDCRGRGAIAPRIFRQPAATAGVLAPGKCRFFGGRAGGR